MTFNNIQLPQIKKVNSREHLRRPFKQPVECPRCHALGLTGEGHIDKSAGHTTIMFDPQSLHAPQACTNCGASMTLEIKPTLIARPFGDLKEN